MAQPKHTCEVAGTAPSEGTEVSAAPQSGAFVAVSFDAPASPANEFPMGTQGSMPKIPSPLVVRHRDGSPYEGDLIRDVLDYRGLRWRSLRGECTTSQDLSRFQALEGKLRQPQDGDDDAARLRMFFRFECDFPARVIYQGVHGAPIAANVTVQDISAGGVKVSTDREFEAGERVELVFLVDDDSQRIVNLPARIAWTREGAVGLMFAGPPA